MLLLIALPVFSALLIFTLYCRYSDFGRKLEKIPGPPGWPLLGNAIDTFMLDSESVFSYLRFCHKTYGPFYKIYSLLIGIVQICTPEDAQILLSTTKFNDKNIPYNFMRNWLCEGLLLSNGSKWRQRRKLLTPSFHFSILKGFCCAFNEHTSKFLSIIDKESEKDQTDIREIVAKTTLHIMCETAMGTSLKSSDTVSVIDKYFEALLELGDLVQRRVVTVWLHFEWIHRLLPMARKENKLVADMHALTNKVIQDRRNLNESIADNTKNNIEIDGKHRLAMLDLLLEMEKEGQIDKNGVREEVDTFMFEGHDTTSIAFSLMIMRIANETKVQEKIYEELHQIFGDSSRLPTVEDLNNMKYLECCIKESLRLYPSVPLIARHISEEVTLGNCLVPEGVTAFIHVFDIHRIPSIYPDPERFDPDRFLPENCVKRHPYAYIPFSAGPRNCIGQKFAMYELKTVMSGLIRRFRLEPVTKPEDIVFIADLVLRSRDPLYVRFRNRLPTLSCRHTEAV